MGKFYGTSLLHFERLIKDTWEEMATHSSYGRLCFQFLMHLIQTNPVSFVWPFVALAFDAHILEITFF